MLRPEDRPRRTSTQRPGWLRRARRRRRFRHDDRDGLRIARRHTQPGVHPYDEIEWELRDAVITNERGEVTFEQRNVEVPKSWSQLATNVVAQKYFRGQLGTPEREHSVRQLIDRVVADRRRAGAARAATSPATEDAEAFEAELTYLLVHQMVSFNSPVWFNCGVEEHPQVSACFINSVEDTMGSILDLAKTEGMLFKFGSGTGSNLSPLRSSRENARRRRHRLGSGLVHEGLRRLRRRDQVGRQDPPRGEDGHPQRRPSRHRGVHRLQGRRREEGLGADRRRATPASSTSPAAPTTRSSSRTPTTRSASSDEFMRAVLERRRVDDPRGDLGQADADLPGRRS